MAHFRHFPAKILVQQLVLGRRVNPLLATNDMGNAHQMIVHHIGEVIGGHAIRLQQYLHVDLLPGDFDLTPQAIIDDADALLRHFHANHMRGAGFQP